MAAFRRAKKEDPYSLPQDAPTWANRTRENVGGTWATFDPESDTFQMDDTYEGGNTGGKIFEDADWIGGEEEEGEDVTARFKTKFVADRDIMYDNQPRSDFDVRNAELRGLGGGVRPNRKGFREIQVEIGNRDYKSRQRATSGEYQNAKPHQMAKKSRLEEMKQRLAQRDGEMTEAWSWTLAWNRLSEEEKQRHRDEKKDWDQKVMESFRLQVVGEVPDEVTGIGIDLQNLNFDEAASSDSMDFTYSGGEDDRSSRRSQGSSRQRDNRSRSPRQSFASASHLVSQPSNSIRSSVRGGMLPPPPPSSSMSSSSRPQSLNRSVRYDLPERARTSSGSFRPVEQPFRVGHHPVILPPPEDLDGSAIPQKIDDASEVSLMRIFKLNSLKPRVLTIRLDPKVTTPFPEAITDRMWGGMLQQLIFDPDSRHAVAIFVTATGCAAFLTHWRSIEQHGGAAEMRRLQIAVDWHEGSEETAIMASQRNVIRAVCYSKATRVLVIHGLDKHIKKQDAEAGFRSRVGLDRVICKGRLVVPSKMYQKQDERSNKLVVEFASILDAVDVRTELNEGRLSDDFAGCNAEFARDPVDKPPVARDYCNCRWCKKTREGTIVPAPVVSLTGSTTTSVRM